jgi:fibronectin type 3 domain-containing protein
METGVSVFHFSIKADEKRPLNYSHEYQVVYIESHDGTHVFDIQLGESIHVYEQTYDHVPYGFDIFT